MPFYDKLLDTSDYYLFEYRKVLATPHFHAASEFVFMRKGKLSTTINGKNYVLKEGDACFCPPFSIHSYQLLTETNEAYVIGVKKKTGDSLFSLFQKKYPPEFFHFDDYSLLDFLMGICNTAYKDPTLTKASFDSAIQILYIAISEQYDFIEQKKDSHDFLVSKILNYATDNFNTPLTLDVLSKEFGYARETISRILHRFLGESWNSYVNRLRVYNVQRLLHNHPDKSVSEVLYACGFNSPNTFYRAYMREFGIPPRNTPPRIVE